MTARIRIPEGVHLLAAIYAQHDATFTVEDHVGKCWVAVDRNPAHVAVAGAREVLA